MPFLFVDFCTPLILLLSACSKEETSIKNAIEIDRNFTLEGDLETSGSAGNNNKAVQLNMSSHEGTYARFTSQFEGSIQPYSFYPASEDNKVELDNDGVFTFNFPAVQQYNGNSFADGANIAIAQLVKNEDNRNYSACFKNVFGYLKLTFTAPETINVRKLELRDNDDNGQDLG